ncbi:MAG: rRNA pseudouridine synthase [Rhodospirillaceae bacterium]|jgi:23S rRNA pseudouridine2605 synthase|nr:rRNA pseudouridine synthase [Rhodospirillaceae bacterium]
MINTPKINGERISKRLAQAGLCSRRDAERWISKGRVKIDGQLLISPATIVTKSNLITVDGKALPTTTNCTRLWRYYKPSGLITSHKDPYGRPTVFNYLPKNIPRVISVGRLDLNSEGLLLLSNDGSLTRQLELPSTGLIRRYHVRVYGKLNMSKLVAIERGIAIEGVTYSSIKISLNRQNGSNAWLTVSLNEGKNREIKKVMEYFDLIVNRLIRISYGSFYLNSLKSNEIDEVSPKIVKNLKEQFGISNL